MTRYFVTGTDTGVGKTYVTAALAGRGRLAGRRVFAWKPVETGCDVIDGRRLGADQEAISSEWQTGPLRGLYQFAVPAAPSVAAEAENTAVDLELVRATFQRGAEGADLVLVEGAGGWRVPVTHDVDMAGLARLLELPVLVVARAGLGTINHTLLTVEAVQRDGLEVSGVVMSCQPSDNVEFAKQNAREIGRRFPGRVLLLGRDPVVLDELL